jgi:cobaltochelatase CobT
MRAITGNGELHYRGRQLHQGTQRLAVLAPHLRIPGDVDDFAACRGAADATALRLLHSDPKIYRELCPDANDLVARLMFEWLEQMRVETLVRDDMPGMRRNLLQRFEHWSRDFYRAGLTEDRLGILLFTAAQMCWSRLNSRRVLAETEDYIEGWRYTLASSLGMPLVGMRRHRNDQRQFAPYALEVARTIGAMAQGEQMAGGRCDAPRGDVEDRETTERLALLLEFEPGGDEPAALATRGGYKACVDNGPGYRVYTTRYDAEVEAQSLARQVLLREYREILDRRVMAQGINLSRLARLLQTALAESDRDGWLFGEEEGHIDGRRLARLVTSPAERRVFRQDRHTSLSNSLVSILVDCSGSMKAHIESVATLSDILLRALEMAGIGSELLGFTTRAWNGGRAWRDWVRQDEPAQPGRLNELLHLVFKSADRSWRHSRTGIATLLKSDLFREGIDGEAVDWACNRMLARSERRRVLIVISDGSPNDSATGRANGACYLDNHLGEVVARHERDGKVDIIGLGVGHDLGACYMNSLIADMTQALDNVLLREIVRAIGRRPRR